MKINIKYIYTQVQFNISHKINTLMTWYVKFIMTDKKRIELFVLLLWFLLASYHLPPFLQTPLRFILVESTISLKFRKTAQINTVNQMKIKRSKQIHLDQIHVHPVVFKLKIHNLKYIRKQKKCIKTRYCTC